MPPIRTSRNRKPPPAGFEDIEDILLEFSNKMKDAENASHEGKKRHEVLWPIFQISHQRMSLVLPLCENCPDTASVVKRIFFLANKPAFVLWPGSRYIYDMYYEKEAISKQLYDWLLKNNYADANLIAKWKKQGYEKVDRSPISRPYSSSYLWHLPTCNSACLPTSNLLSLSFSSPLINLLVPITLTLKSPNLLCQSSYVAFAAFRPRKQTSMRPVYAVYPRHS